MPITVPRTVSWVGAAAGHMSDSEGARIRPPGCEEIFHAKQPSFGQFICIEDDIHKDDHTGLMMHRLFGTSFWFRKYDGELVKYGRYEDSEAKEFLSSFFIQLNRIPPFLKNRAKSLGIKGDTDMPVFYFPSCTVTMSVEVDDLDAALERRHPLHRDASYADLVGTAHALPPESNHRALTQLAQIKADLELHTQILRDVTGLDLALGTIQFP